MKIRAFITHKAKEQIADCQDRFAINEETKIVAVSDGVSQSIFSAYWAQLLVDHYCQFGQLTNDDRISLCGQWVKHVRNYIEEEKAKGRNPWRTESNLAEGYSAGATLCGVRFKGDQQWFCDVIGDSCLIKVDDNNEIEILSSEDKKFDNSPDYLDSHPKKKGRGDFKTYKGTLSKSAKLILVTDPFSDFFLKNKPDAPKYIEQMLSLNSHEEFTSLVDEWRGIGMKNDDSTIVIVEWDGSSDFNILHSDNMQELSAKENEKQEAESIQPAAPTSNVSVEPQATIPEQIVAPAQKKKSDADDSERKVEEYKLKLEKQIPEFVEDYMRKKKKPKKTFISSMIECLSGKKKEKQLVIEDILHSYIKYVK